MLGVAAWMLWRFADREVDIGTVKVGDARRPSRPRAAGGHEPAAGASDRAAANTPEAVLAACFGQVPPIPSPSGRDDDVVNVGKQVVRGGFESAVDAMAPPLTRRDEDEVARGLARKVRRETRVWHTRRQRERIASIVRRLARHVSRYGQDGYRFELLDSKQVNAFMGPGGQGYVYRGLIGLMHSDDALAFVLGHELAHGELHHLDASLRAAKAGRELGGALGGAEGGEAGALLASLVATVARVTYDQDQEYEADRLGFCLAILAGYSAQGAIDAMSALRSQEGHEPASSGRHSILYDIIRTHPPTTERRAYLRRLRRALRRGLAR